MDFDRILRNLPNHRTFFARRGMTVSYPKRMLPNILLPTKSVDHLLLSVRFPLQLASSTAIPLLRTLICRRPFPLKLRRIRTGRTNRPA